MVFRGRGQARCIIRFTRGSFPRLFEPPVSSSKLPGTGPWPRAGYRAGSDHRWSPQRLVELLNPVQGNPGRLLGACAVGR